MFLYFYIGFFVYVLKIIVLCNEKYSCILEFSNFNFFVRIFIILCGCCIDYFYFIRVGVFFECLFCKYFNNLMFCFLIYVNYLLYKYKNFIGFLI